MRWTEAMRGAGAVFFRDAVRGARQWQTWALRVGVSLVVLLSFAALLDDVVADPDLPTAATRYGRDLFVGYSAFLMLVGGGLATVLVGVGMAEEREDDTVTLLALTRLSARQIVLGKVVSRLLGVLLVVLAAMPVFAFATAIGGVSVWEVVNASVNTVVAVVLLGTLGGLMGIYTRGVATLTAGAFTYSLVAFVLLPIGADLAWLSGDRLRDMTSPVFGAAADGPTGLVAGLLFVPITGVLLWSAGPLFARAVVEHEGSSRATEQHAADRIRAWAGWLGLGVVLAYPPLLAASPRWFRPVGLSSEWVHLASVVWVAAFDLALALLLVLGLRQVGRGRAHWLALQRARTRTERPPLWRGRVWGHPMAWREAVTRRQGEAVHSAWLIVLWLAVCALSLLAFPLDLGRALIVITGVFASGGLAVVRAADSLSSEVRGHTLELLKISRLSGASIVAGKLAAVAIHTLPFLVVGLLALEVMPRTPSSTGVISCDGLGQVARWPGAFNLILLAWLAAVWAWITLAAMLGGMWLRARSLWAIAAGVVVGWGMVPVLAELVLPAQLARGVTRVALPIVDTAYCQPTWWLIAAVVAHAVFAVILFVLTAYHVGRAGTS